MSKNSHGRKPKAKRPSGDDTGDRIHEARRAYKRSHQQEWQSTFEGEEIEELDDFEELNDIEDSEINDLEQLIESDEEEQS